MSVLFLDPKVFEYVADKINSYKFSKQADINHCSTLSIEDQSEAQKLVVNWAKLNELSYNYHYNEPEKQPTLYKFINFSNYYKVDTYQFLKYLLCIRYNIELHTIQGGRNGFSGQPIEQELKDSFDTLNKAIEEIKQAIINELTEYKTANWSDPVTRIN